MEDDQKAILVTWERSWGRGCIRKVLSNIERNSHGRLGVWVFQAGLNIQ